MDIGFAFFLIIAEIMGQKDGASLIAQLKDRDITGTKVIIYWHEECNQDIAVLREKMAIPFEQKEAE